MSPPYKRAYHRYVEEHGLPLVLQPVLYWICDKANKEGLAWPGREKLAKLAGCSEKHIQRATRELAAMGLLEIGTRANRSKSMQYQVLLAPVPPASKRGTVSPPLEPEGTPQRGTVSPPLSPALEAERGTVSPERGTVSPDDYKGTGTRSEPGFEPVFKEKTEEGANFSPAFLDDEDPEVDFTAGPKRCEHQDPLEPCPHESEALALLTPLYESRPDLKYELPLERHRNLHWFVHHYGVDNLMLLARDKVAHEKNPNFLSLPTLCSPNHQPDKYLRAAKGRLEETQAKAQKKACHHPGGQIVFEQAKSIFRCRACDKLLDDEQAAARGVSREDFVYDVGPRMEALVRQVGWK